MERCLIEPATERTEVDIANESSHGSPLVRRSSSPEETEDLGESIAHGLKPGAVIALKGSLGAGKTCLVKGIARGLRIAENITSPTYTIISEYEARLSGPASQGGKNIPFYHIDAYRLRGDDDFENTGAGEYFGANGIIVIEWCDRIPRSIPPDAITITIEITGPQNRKITISGDE